MHSTTYIRDLKKADRVTGDECLLIQDVESTKQAPLGVVIDKVVEKATVGVAEAIDEFNTTANQQIADNQQQIDTFVNDAQARVDEALNKVQNIDNRLAQTDAQLSQKLDKNGIVTMANMGQDVKEAMTGGSVAVVGRDSVLTENIVNGQVTVIKTDFITDGDNLINPERINVGYSMYDDGSLAEGYNDQFYIDIDALPNTTYSCKLGFGKLVQLTYDKEYVDSCDLIGTFTTSNTTKFLRYNGLVDYVDEYVICLGKIVPETAPKHCYVMPKLSVKPNNIENKSISEEKLSENLSSKIQDLSANFYKQINRDLKVVKGITGKDVSVDPIWSNGSLVVIQNAIIGDERIFDIRTEPGADGVYQTSLTSFNNSEKELHVRYEYEVIEIEGSVDLRDNNANYEFPVALGNHAVIYTTTSDWIKFEFGFHTDSRIKIKIKNLSVIDFNGMQFSHVDINNFFNKFGYVESAFNLQQPFISSSMIGNRIITFEKLSNDVANAIKTSNWKDKIWVSYGDSITEQNLYQQVVINELGINHINKGVGGTTACGTSENCGWQDSRINDFPEKIDLITIMFGTNDWSQNKLIGEDDGDTNTYKGALGVIIRKLQTKYPFARIVLMSPPYRTSSQWNEEPLDPYQNGLSIIDFGNAVHEMARKYGLPFVDTYHDMGVNIVNFKHFLLEETWPVHPNEDGADRMGGVLLDTIKKIDPK